MKPVGFKLSFGNSTFLRQAEKTEAGIAGRENRVRNGMAPVRFPGHASLERARVCLKEQCKTR